MNVTRTRRLLLTLHLLAAVATVSNQAVSLAATRQASFTVQIVADDMCCKGCAQKVAAQLYAAPGVTSVTADVPKRIVKVTAKQSPKLTLERLWQAVEKAKGGPSKLITSRATYSLTRPNQLPLEQPPVPGKYTIEVPQIGDQAAAQRLADQVATLRGVEHVDVDSSTLVLIVQSTADQQVHVWALAALVERAGFVPSTITGPHGTLTIEQTVTQQTRATASKTQNTPHGEVR